MLAGTLVSIGSCQMPSVGRRFTKMVDAADI